MARAPIQTGVQRSAVVELLKCVACVPRVGSLTDAGVAPIAVDTDPVVARVKRTLVYVRVAFGARVPRRAVAHSAANPVGTGGPVLAVSDTIVYVGVAAHASIPGETVTGVHAP